MAKQLLLFAERVPNDIVPVAVSPGSGTHTNAAAYSPAESDNMVDLEAVETTEDEQGGTHTRHILPLCRDTNGRSRRDTGNEEK